MVWFGGKDGDVKDLILIVEDEEETAALLKQILAGQGYQSKHAENGNDALKEAEKMSPNLIVLDVMLPGMDGSQILTKLKSESKTKEIPVIMCTALNDIKDVERFFRMGAAGYITKPFEPERVIAKINSILRPQ